MFCKQLRKLNVQMAIKGYSQFEIDSALLLNFLHNNRFRFDLTLLALRNSNTYVLLILSLRTGQLGKRFVLRCQFMLAMNNGF